MYLSQSEPINRELSPGERLLWSGQPRSGPRLTPGDIALVPFSLLWAGFAVFWESMVLKQGPPGFMALWGIPFILMGVYMVIGRFFVDAYRRGRTYYGLTNRRVIIVGGMLGRSVNSLDLATLPAIQVSERGDGSGTISFGPYTGAYPEWLAGSWPGAGRGLAPRFEMLEGARGVYDKIREAQGAARAAGA